MGAEEVKSAENADLAIANRNSAKLQTGMAAGKAVSREQERDATAVARWPFMVLAVAFINHERSFPDRFAKIIFGIGCFLPAGRVRWIRGSGWGRRPIGFPRVSSPDFD